MGFGSFMKSLGKGLLKVGKIAAPIALGMTGVGIPAAMAVGGGLNALDKKVSGGSWKQALGAGALGAGTGALGGIGGGMLGKATSGGLSKFMQGLGKFGSAARIMGGSQPIGNDLPQQGGITGRMPYGGGINPSAGILGLLLRNKFGNMNQGGQLNMNMPSFNNMFTPRNGGVWNPKAEMPTQEY